MAKKAAQAKPRFTCRDCKNSFDWYGKDYKGDVFMCKCAKSQWSKLLSMPQCEHFELNNK